MDSASNKISVKIVKKLFPILDLVMKPDGESELKIRVKSHSFERISFADAALQVVWRAIFW